MQSLKDQVSSTFGFGTAQGSQNIGRKFAFVAVGAVAVLAVSSFVVTAIKLTVVAAIIAAAASEKRNKLLPPLLVLGAAAYLLTPLNLLLLTAAGGAAAVHLYHKK